MAKKKAGKAKKSQNKLNAELFAATERGAVREVRKLLDHGADVNASDQHQQTPLHWARNEAIAKLLLDHGADVDASTHDPSTPLHYAKNAAIAKLLLDHGVDVNARDELQRTPLHLADNVAIARLVVSRGAQLTAVIEDGRNALHFTALWANLDICLFLVSRGLDPNIADNKGETALTQYGRHRGQDDDDEEKQEAVVQLLAAREAYEQRVRDEHWKKNWPLMNTLTSSGLRPMSAEVAALAAQQAASDKSVKLPGIPRITKAQNIAFLNQAVFGRENEHLFLRHIVGFIPRTRFEEGEGEEDAEEEKLLRQEMAKNKSVLEQSQATIAQAQAHLKQLQNSHEQAEAQQAKVQARLDALVQARVSRRIEDSERGFPASSSARDDDGE